MFEVPGSDVRTVLITEECVTGHAQPEYIRGPSNTTTSTDEPPNTQTTSTEEEENTQVRVKQ